MSVLWWSSINAIILVESVREAVVKSVASPIAVSGSNSTTVMVDDTLDAELLAEIDQVGNNPGADDEEKEEAGAEDVENDVNDDVDSDGAGVASDVEMQDMSEQGLESVAELFG